MDFQDIVRVTLAVIIFADTFAPESTMDVAV